MAPGALSPSVAAVGADDLRPHLMVCGSFTRPQQLTAGGASGAYRRDFA
jgi:hypothetical protein